MLGPASPNALVPQAVSGQSPNQRSMENMFMSASFPADPGGLSRAGPGSTEWMLLPRTSKGYILIGISRDKKEISVPYRLTFLNGFPELRPGPLL